MSSRTHLLTRTWVGVGRLLRYWSKSGTNNIWAHSGHAVQLFWVGSIQLRSRPESGTNDTCQKIGGQVRYTISFLPYRAPHDTYGRCVWQELYHALAKRDLEINYVKKEMVKIRCEIQILISKNNYKLNLISFKHGMSDSSLQT